jgi:hypothetical protein
MTRDEFVNHVFAEWRKTPDVVYRRLRNVVPLLANEVEGMYVRRAAGVMFDQQQVRTQARVKHERANWDYSSVRSGRQYIPED